MKTHLFNNFTISTEQYKNEVREMGNSVFELYEDKMKHMSFI